MNINTQNSHKTHSDHAERKTALEAKFKFVVHEMEVCKLCTSSRSLHGRNLFNIGKHFSKEDEVTKCLSRRVCMSRYIDRNMTVKTIICHRHAR